LLGALYLKVKCVRVSEKPNNRHLGGFLVLVSKLSQSTCLASHGWRNAILVVLSEFIRPTFLDLVAAYENDRLGHRHAVSPS
jgi:hypothetical protein